MIHGLKWIALAALVSGCAAAPQSAVQNTSKPSPPQTQKSAGDLIIVADAVGWPSKLWFCPVSEDGTFETDCPRAERLPRPPGSSNSIVDDFWSLGPQTIGQQGGAFTRALGEVGLSEVDQSE